MLLRVDFWLTCSPPPAARTGSPAHPYCFHPSLIHCEPTSSTTRSLQVRNVNMKGTAALVSTAIVSAGGWVAIHASLHSTLPSYNWLESSNGAHGNDVAIPKQGISEETNASAYCAQHSPVETSSISTSPLASNEVIEMTQLKSLCAAWNDKTPHHKYKAIKFNSCPFWLHEHGDDKARQSGPKISITNYEGKCLGTGRWSNLDQNIQIQSN